MTDPARTPPLPTQDDDPAWAATRAQAVAATQILEDRDESEPGAQKDIGRDVGNGQRELFISCGPAEALLQQFEVLQPDFVAIHDLGCAVSRRLVASIAAASQRPAQTLTIRRQGYGTALAKLEFVEWASPGSRVIRLYTTEIEAEPAARRQIAQALLAHSRLGVLIVGDLKAQAIDAALEPIRQAMQAREWPNRELLMLPLGSSSVIAEQAHRLSRDGGIAVRSTPQVTRQAAVWSYLSDTWNRWRQQQGTAGLALPMLPAATAPTPAPTASRAAAGPADVPWRATPSAPPPVAAPTLPAAIGAPPVLSPPPATPPAPAAPLRMQAMPPVPRGGPRVHSLADQLIDYVSRLLKLNGMRCVCIFDRDSGEPQAHAGALFSASAMAAQGHAWMRACLTVGHGLAMPLEGPEAALTLGAHHLVLRPLPKHSNLLLLAVLDKEIANLTLARLQIQRLDEDFSI